MAHWALARSGAGLLARLRVELALSLTATAPSPAPTPLPVADAVALEHGLVPSEFRATLRRSALTEIVAPCLDALAASAPAAAASRANAA